MAKKSVNFEPQENGPPHAEKALRAAQGLQMGLGSHRFILSNRREDMLSLERLSRRHVLEKAILKHRYRLIELTQQANFLLKLKRIKDKELSPAHNGGYRRPEREESFDKSDSIGSGLKRAHFSIEEMG